MKTKDTEVLGKKQNQSPIQQLTDLLELLVSLCTIIIVHNTARERQFSLYSPSSRPTSHLRCGQVEVKG